MTLTLIKISNHFNHVVVQVHQTHVQYLVLAIGSVEQQTCQIQWINLLPNSIDTSVIELEPAVCNIFLR